MHAPSAVENDPPKSLFETGSPGAQEVLAFCRERMARFEVLKTVVFGPLPSTSTGKIQKHVLREKASLL